MAGRIQTLALVRQQRNTATISRRNLQIIQGEDINLAVTVWNSDTDLTPVDLSTFTPWISVFREAGSSNLTGLGYPLADYGLGFATSYGPILQLAGTLPGAMGRVDFNLLASVTGKWNGRYWFVIQINTATAVTALATGTLDVMGSNWINSGILVPAPGLPPNVLGTWDISQYNDGSVYK